MAKNLPMGALWLTCATTGIKASPGQHLPVPEARERRHGPRGVEGATRKYVAAGGRRPDDEEAKLQLAELLPDELSSSLSWRIDEFSSYETM